MVTWNKSKKWMTVFGMVLAISLCGYAQEQEGKSASVTIDVTQSNEPISKYIYGQFIEHLGRCIYGGIWAEMLEDRKFYFPITDEFKPWKTESDRDGWNGGDFPALSGSPWKVIGRKGSVRMEKNNPFVGEQTPEIMLTGETAGGIEQGELALQTNRSYTGYVILSGDKDAAPIRVSLSWGDQDGDQETMTLDSLSGDYQKYPLQFTAKGDTPHGRLRIAGSGKGAFRIGTVSLMPADNVQGFRADTLALLKELNSPIYRWPGGNFVSDYNWKDGIGDRDKRPPRKNPAWTGIEPNDVGIHEFMVFCGLIHTEPYISVNTGMGTVGAAAEEVEYCNGSTDTPMGKWRAENGHSEPFAVKYWAVGNEMYGNWQKGHMPLSDYVKKHDACVDAMRAVDPAIQLVAVGSVGDWSKTMLTQCADHMDLLSEHIYQRNKEDLVEHVALLANDIKRVADAHRQYRATIEGLKEKNIRIAMDEWNYWYGPYIYGELGVQYHLQDALGVAKGLHEYFRNSDIFFMANYAQTVNVIGCIKTSKTAATFDTTGLVLELYRNHFGEIPLTVGDVPKPLDVAAALTSDKRKLTVAIVNPTTEALSMKLQFKGIALGSGGQVWQISGIDKMACNVPGKEPAVRLVEDTVQDSAKPLSLPPMSVNLYSFEIQ